MANSIVCTLYYSDGHSGHLASEFLSSQLPAELDKLDTHNTDTIKNTTFELEHQILTDTETRKSGSTAVFCLVKPLSASQYELTLANVGDSLGLIISSTGDIKFATRAHVPSDPIESERIIANGGFVHRARVDGRLAMSRSMGDAKYKDLYQSNQLFNFINQKVTSEADVVNMTVDAGDSLLLCSDGVTADLSINDIAGFITKYITQPVTNNDDDTITNDNIGKYAQQNITDNNPMDQTGYIKHSSVRPEEATARDFSRSYIDPGTIASRLLDLSFSEGSTDNMTAVLVSFTHGNDYVSKYIDYTNAEKKPTTKVLDNNTTVTANPNNYSCNTIIEFLPGPYHKYSSDELFQSSYMSFSARHGFTPQYDDNGVLTALEKNNKDNHQQLSSIEHSDTDELPSFDDYTQQMRSKRKLNVPTAQATKQNI